MSKKANIPLDDDDDDDVLAQRISDTAKRQGIPSLTPAPVSNSPAGLRRPIKIEVTDELFDALTIAAAERRVTKRHLILTALRDAGFPISDTDLREDGRRLRGSRKE